jgi:hypothetical protein
MIMVILDLEFQWFLFGGIVGVFYFVLFWILVFSFRYVFLDSSGSLALFGL